MQIYIHFHTLTLYITLRYCTYCSLHLHISIHSIDYFRSFCDIFNMAKTCVIASSFPIDNFPQKLESVTSIGPVHGSEALFGIDLLSIQFEL